MTKVIARSANFSCAVSFSWLLLFLLVGKSYASVSLLDLQTTATPDSLIIAWNNNISAADVYATVSLHGATQVCQKSAKCNLAFTGLSADTSYQYSIKLVDTADNSQLLESANVTTLPLLSISGISIDPSQTSAEFIWKNNYAASDAAAILSSITINGVSTQCNSSQDCADTIYNLKPNVNYLYTISATNTKSNMHYSTSGDMKTLAYPPISLGLKDIDERCSATSCNDVLTYSVSGGRPPYSVHFNSAQPAVIAEQSYANNQWLVQLDLHTVYDIKFSATDSNGATGSAQIKITSGG